MGSVRAYYKNLATALGEPPEVVFEIKRSSENIHDTNALYFSGPCDSLISSVAKVDGQYPRHIITIL